MAWNKRFWRDFTVHSNSTHKSKMAAETEQSCFSSLVLSNKMAVNKK